MAKFVGKWGGVIANLVLAGGSAFVGAAALDKVTPPGGDQAVPTPIEQKSGAVREAGTGMSAAQYDKIKRQLEAKGIKAATKEELTSASNAAALKTEEKDLLGRMSRLAVKSAQFVSGKRDTVAERLVLTPEQKKNPQYAEKPGSDGRPEFGALLGLAVFGIATWLSQKFTGRSVGGLMYPESPKQTAHDHVDEQLKHFDEQFKAHQVLTKWPHAEENQKAAAQADFNGQAAQSVDAAPSVAQPAASSEAKNLDVLLAQASLKDKGMPRGPS